MSSGLEFDEFYRNDLVPLIAFLSKAGFEREDARDAAAEAMICAYCEWKRVHQPHGWVRRVAYRIAAKQAKRSRELSVRASEAGLAETRHRHDDETAAVDQRLRILGLLDGLPPQQRVAMAWHLEGYRTAEIAEYMEIDVATVRSNLRHARQKLKTGWQSEGGAFDEPQQ